MVYHTSTCSWTKRALRRKKTDEMERKYTNRPDRCMIYTHMYTHVHTQIFIDRLIWFDLIWIMHMQTDTCRHTHTYIYLSMFFDSLWASATAPSRKRRPKICAATTSWHGGVWGPSSVAWARCIRWKAEMRNVRCWVLMDFAWFCCMFDGFVFNGWDFKGILMDLTWLNIVC